MESIASNKHSRIKILKKNRTANFNSNPSERFDAYAGLLNPAPHSPLPLSAHQYGQNQQPPLLPRPSASAIHHQSLLSRTLSSQKDKTRDMSLAPKKSKPVKKRSTQSMSDLALKGKEFGTENMDMFSSWVFSLSPPPSSLPLPKFCVGSKLSCKTEAAGIDTGATDNLRRLLHIP